MLASARLKIQRADKHIKEVIDAVATLPDRYIASIETDYQACANAIKYEFPEVDSFVNDLALAIGDALHNLRTGIDHAWFETVRRVAPQALSKFSKFPFYKSATDLEATLKGQEINISSPALFKCVLSAR